MPTLLFSLRNVPDDEADDIRSLLSQHQIPYYETPPGNWGISMPALWLNQSEDLGEAQRLLAIYQQERAINQRALCLHTKRRVSLKDWLIRLVYLCAGLMILYISIRWVIDLNTPKRLINNH